MIVRPPYECLKRNHGHRFVFEKYQAATTHCVIFEEYQAVPGIDVHEQYHEQALDLYLKSARQ